MRWVFTAHLILKCLEFECDTASDDKLSVLLELIFQFSEYRHFLGKVILYTTTQVEEDVAVAVGLMANSGIKGSQAGTALRATLTRLAKPTKQSATAII